MSRGLRPRSSSAITARPDASANLSWDCKEQACWPNPAAQGRSPPTHRLCCWRYTDTARARRRACNRFEFGEIRIGHGGVRADRLEHVEHGYVLSAESSRQDRAAVEKSRRDVEAQHRHHKPWKGLVAAGHPDEGVVAVPTHREFDRVGDDLSDSDMSQRPTTVEKARRNVARILDLNRFHASTRHVSP